MDTHLHSRELIIITSYPPQGTVHSKDTVGVASYTKNTVLALQKAIDNHSSTSRITILAETLKGQEASYDEGNVHIQRVWKRKTFFVFNSLLNHILTRKNSNKILIEFELSMFGGLISLIQFPLFLLILRLFNKEVYLVLHQVIEDIGEFSGHINVQKTSLSAKLLNVCIKIFYSSTMRLVKKVIVFEEVLKEKILQFTKRPVTVIPHGVETFTEELNTARHQNIKVNNDFVILCFGFLAWYKGTDWIISEFEKFLEKNPQLPLKLVLAGGPNPNHQDKLFYQDYVKDIHSKTKKFPEKIVVTGFVAEEEIAEYFQAADIIVLPYRILMSSSGPLSIALSFHKPFLISEILKPILQTYDSKESLKNNNLTPEDISFPLSGNELFNKIQNISQNQDTLHSLTTFSSELAKKRSFNSIVEQYYKELELK